MKKILLLIVFILSCNLVWSQKTKTNREEFKYPVLVKLIEGSGNVFRIGFIRHNDYWNIKEDVNNPQNIYANFIDLTELKNKIFVYFPTSDSTGEMTIVDNKDITKLDMTYEQALEVMIPKK